MVLLGVPAVRDITTDPDANRDPIDPLEGMEDVKTDYRGVTAPPYGW